MPIAIDATYSIGEELTGVGVYSHEILTGLATAHPKTPFLFCYRSRQYIRSFRQRLFRNCSRFLLHDEFRVPSGELFHGLNQRMPVKRMKRRVCTFHDLFVLTQNYSTPEFRKVFAARAQRAAERCDLIVTVSQFTADQVEEHLNVERSRIRVIHHGVREAVDRTTLPRENLILHVGAIQQRKNITRLVEAFETVPKDWRLVLAGSSSGFGAADILKRIESSPARERIQITGYLSGPALDRIFARARIFAFPSLDEGFGMPVLEAMMRGVPVITSNRSALPEVAGEAALQINPEETEELAAALHRLIADSDLGAKMVAAGKDRAAKFSWRSAVNKTWGVYRELAGPEIGP
ncbi:MAG: glycosyltransferase family 1 protein [Bryobacteraceae bacterium]